MVGVAYLILGVDPGTTTGLAALDLRGKLLLLSSARSADDSWILSMVSSRGVPVIVATDVVPAPSRVEKIAAQFGAKLWAPSAKISVSFQDDVARRFGGAPEDDHQRDALSAAYAAYLHYAPKFRSIDARYGHDERLSDYLKRAAIFGTPISKALDEWAGSESVPARRRKHVSSSGGSSELSRLHATIADLRRLLGECQRENERLKQQVVRLRGDRDRLKRLLKYVPSDERYQRMRMERDDALRRLAELRREYQRLLDLIDAVGAGDAVVVSVSTAEKHGAILASSKQYAIVRPHADGSESAEVLAKKILELVEEYRSRRL